MFPVGAAGWGLLLLRVCAAGILMRGGMPAAPTTLFIGQATVAALLCLGLFTPASCVAAGIIQIAIGCVLSGRDPFQLVFSISVDLALLLIGPGAFSIDSRLFGRRLIVSSK